MGIAHQREGYGSYRVTLVPHVFTQMDGRAFAPTSPTTPNGGGARAVLGGGGAFLLLGVRYVIYEGAGMGMQAAAKTGCRPIWTLQGWDFSQSSHAI
jgi:hypothetical protein